jgi:hypothetical protein
MTSAEIDALPAGPGLDGLIAEKVMGFRTEREVARVAGEPDRFVYYYRNQIVLNIPPYSTSRDAAAHVLGELRNRSAIIDLSLDVRLGEFSSCTLTLPNRKAS